MNSEPMARTDADSTLDKMIDSVLEQQPQVAIPVDFAARVATQAAALPQRSPMRRTHYGRAIALIAALIAMCALFAIAPHAAPSITNLAFATEMILLLQLGGLAWWLTKPGAELL